MVEILFEDNHIIAINKPTGALVQGDRTGDTPIVDEVKQYIKKKYNKPGDVFLGLPHRLDRPVSGVVLFARTSKALTRLAKIFRDKEIQKTYWAITEGMPPKQSDKLTHDLVKDHKLNISRVAEANDKDAKKAVLSYLLIRSDNKLQLIEVNPITGRPHQIRVQLASIGCAIIGDTKYGYRKTNKDKSICLHARQLEFVHPVRKKPVKIIANVPEDSPMWSHFK